MIYDRHVLDSIMRLRAIYGPSHRFRLQLLLLPLLAPRARSRFLLDLDPEGSVVRKDDRWSLDELCLHADLYRSESDRLGGRVLDADRARDGPAPRSHARFGES